MEISKLINSENNVAVRQALTIAKQDIQIENSVKALTELTHCNKIVFESYGEQLGLTPELILEAKALIEKLNKAKYGRF